MLFEKLSISLLLIAGMAAASASPGRNPEERAADQPVRQQQKAPERNEAQVVRDNNGQAVEDGAKKHGRLTQEERRALRRQINEAGQDIYLPKP